MDIFDLLEGLNYEDNLYIYEENAVSIMKLKTFLKFLDEWEDFFAENEIVDFAYIIKEKCASLAVYMKDHGRNLSYIL